MLSIALHGAANHGHLTHHIWHPEPTKQVTRCTTHVIVVGSTNLVVHCMATVWHMSGFGQRHVVWLVQICVKAMSHNLVQFPGDIILDRLAVHI
jgi:hypothetical protein